MRILPFLAVLGLFIGAMAAQTAPPPAYRVTTIPLLPGYNVMSPTALNKAGDVVGVASNTTGSPAAHTFLYEGGKVRDLGALGTPIAINAFGAILTSSSLYQGGRSVASAPVGSIFIGLNDIGQIIGGDDAFQPASGFLRQPNGTIVPLTFKGSVAYPVAINDVGQIVANYTVPNPFTGYNPVTGLGYASQTGPMHRVVLFQPGGKNGVDIGTLGFWTFAGAINNRGQVAANSQVLDNSDSEYVYEAPVDAVLYWGGTLTNLAVTNDDNEIPYGGGDGNADAIPAAINDFGTIVGTFIAVVGEDSAIATLFTGGQWYTLNEVTTGLPTYPGYPDNPILLTDCVAVNNRGMIIALSQSDIGPVQPAQYFLLTSAPVKGFDRLK
jgi:probable HAF family extracellular repeat protein